MALHFIPPPRKTASVLQMLAVGLTMMQTCWSVKVSGFHESFCVVLNLRLIHGLNMIYWLKNPLEQHMHDH